jgi:hypothetical protein
MNRFKNLDVKWWLGFVVSVLACIAAYLALIPAPLPTPTPTILPPTPTLIRLLQDDFNDDKLDASKWEVGCEQGTVVERDGKVYFHLPPTPSSPYSHCRLSPRVEGSKVRKMSVRVTLTNGIGESSWIGVYSSWDNKYLNLEVCPAWVGVTGDNQRRIRMETFRRLPITRLLRTEWLGNECRFTVADSTMQQSISCADPPPYLWFGVYADHDAYVDGTIDDVEIWGVFP